MAKLRFTTVPLPSQVYKRKKRINRTETERGVPKSSYPALFDLGLSTREQELGIVAREFEA